ncbi:MAG: RNA methyltransferase [Anaerolineae bacterium]|nr:RNA methyltransferase [Anaerolineae bacterium]MBT7070477.1 RNA methyltransferase [Anaerolineae bacterium]MBT7324032.1 RNA methyltransferase [Anaerolineae bacterium]
MNAAKPLSFYTYECSNADCRFRFPLLAGESITEACPKCGASLRDVERPYPRHLVGKGQVAPRPLEIHVILDNIRSLYNVGSIFRTAEATGIAKLHLCGMTATPENPRLAKTSIGAEQMVAWEQHNNGVVAAEKLRAEGFSLWAIEGGQRSTPLFEAKMPDEGQRIVLVVGNELAGIDPEILRIAERVLFIPMQGRKESLNLTVAFGIAAYFLRFL